MDLKYALQIIRDTRDEWYRPNVSESTKNEQVKMQAYVSWAFDEIYLYLLTNHAADPICAIEELTSIGENAAVSTTNEEIDLMYRTLCDICLEVNEILKLTEGDLR